MSSSKYTKGHSTLRGKKGTRTKQSSAHAENVIIHNVNIQIGDYNTIGIDEVKQRILGLKDMEGISKNDVVVGFLHYLLQAEQSHGSDGLDIIYLQRKFEEAFKHDNKSFQEIADLPIDLFVDKNIRTFEKFTKKGKNMVRSKVKSSEESASVTLRIPSTEHKMKRRRGNDSMTTEDRNSDLFTDTDIDTDPDYFTAYGSALSDTSASSESENFDYFKTSTALLTQITTDEDDYQYEISKRKHKHKKRSKTKTVGDDNKNNEKLDLRHLNLVKELIGKPENEDIHFCHSVDLYFDDPKEFMLDLVSLWNTPNRNTSYIILGVQPRSELPHDILGLRKSLQQGDFEKLSTEVWCSKMPLYQYFEVDVNEKKLGVIEIETSFGCGKPSLLKSAVADTDRTTEEDILWVREGTDRKFYPLNDPEAMEMFHWYMGLEIKTTSDGARPKTNVKHKKEKVYVKREDILPVLHNFERGHFVLVTGNIPQGMSNAEAVSFVPWIAVYDFDIFSRDNGLLSSNEDFISQQRSLHIESWNTPASCISENSIVWYFPRGVRDIPDSRVKHENDVRKWFQQVKQGVNKTIEQLQTFVSDYTTITIVVFWPQDDNLAKFMSDFLQRTEERLEPPPKIVLCLPKNEPRSESGKLTYKCLCDYYKDNLSVIKINLSEICEEIKARKKVNLRSDCMYELPGDNGCLLNEKEAAWLKEHLEVLYKTNPYTKRTVENLQAESENFYKGGSLHWFAWYECGPGHFDVERDVMKDVIKKIQDLVDDNRSSLFTLYHAPGSGGTTISQRILWEFHHELPCIHMKIKSPSSALDIVERVEMLYEKSRRTVLLLIDGDDETKVENIFRTMKARNTISVIIYVKRDIRKRTAVAASINQAWLKGDVTTGESKKLALKFGERCHDNSEKKKKLQQLSREVEGSKPHYLYEFGLTIYLHHFKGVESFVRGYLALQDNKTNELKPEQKMLGYLSLVYYYGQSSLSCQFFASLMNLSSNSSVSLADFPEPIEYFVVPDDHDGKTKNIRICHFLIAKEILEQILGRRSAPRGEREIGLGYAARHNLAEFCLDFIDYASRKKVKTIITPQSIIHVLTRTFIFRDNRDVGENALHDKQKPKLSKIMVDIAASPPLFENRFLVLEKLTHAFPDDPNFHAHLGRFYSYCRPDQEEEVEKCFQKALKLCEEKTKNTSCIDDRMKMSLMHVYHMYGTFLQKRIARFTGQSPDDHPEKDTLTDEFSEILEQIVNMANMACSYFGLCREYTPAVQMNSLGFVGEIIVRLQVCDFVQKHFKEDNCQGINGFIAAESTSSSSARKFIKSSISVIDSLFMECYRFLENDDIDHSIQEAQFWYNYLFRGKSLNLDDVATGDDVFAHRLRITARKLKYGTKKSKISFIEDVTSEKDITDIVEMYEKIFREMHRTGIQGSKWSLENDYLEWLFAIRHDCFKKNYKLEEVSQFVRQWRDQLESPMAKFYLFIITSLIGFAGETESLVQAQLLNEDLRKMGKLVLKPKYPREWLGKERRVIKCLLPGTRFLGLNIEDREMKTLHRDLQICKGTICRPNNKKYSGFISFDLGNNTIPVKVFYIPNAVNMATTQFAGTRVEFCLAFSLRHGYEAFSVKQLQKYGCPSRNCSSRVEITSVEDYAQCPSCCRRVYKDQTNRVSD